METVHSFLVSFPSGSFLGQRRRGLQNTVINPLQTVIHGKVLSKLDYFVEGNEMKLKFQWNLLVVVSQNQISNKYNRKNSKLQSLNLNFQSCNLSACLN